MDVMPPSKEWDAPNPTIHPGASEDLKRLGIDVLPGDQGHVTNALADYRWRKRVEARLEALEEAATKPKELPPVEPKLSRRVHVDKGGE